MNGEFFIVKSLMFSSFEKDIRGLPWFMSNFAQLLEDYYISM